MNRTSLFVKEEPMVTSSCVMNTNNETSQNLPMLKQEDCELKKAILEKKHDSSGNEDQNSHNESVQCETCDKIFKNDLDFTFHSLKHCHDKSTATPPLVVHDCLICNKEFSSWKGLNSHNMRKHNNENGETPLLCDICGRSVINIETLKVHIWNHRSNKLYSCKFCGKCFTHHIQLKKHEGRYTGETSYICNDDKNDLTVNDSIHCDVCDKTFKDNLDYGFHSLEHSNNKKFSCHLCNRKFSSSSRYKFEMHLRVHDGTAYYKCKICNKAFEVKTDAIEHKYLHTGEEPFQCDICGKNFMFSKVLKKHHQSQHVEKITVKNLTKYDCLTCKKYYKSWKGLKTHNMRKHKEIADTSALCDICGKKFSSNYKLKCHHRIHTGDKPYSCKFCNKSFSNKPRLTDHERVHTGERPYVCKFCKKGFTQRPALKLHERTHTGERPYICRLCNNGFISKAVMDKHMKNCQG